VKKTLINCEEMHYVQDEDDMSEQDDDEEEKYPGDRKQPQTVLGRKTQESTSPLDRSAEDVKGGFRSSDSGGGDIVKQRENS
jgi:hypothetical protein